MIEGIVKMVRHSNPMMASSTIEEPTIHDLFNELHRRLCIECESKPLNETVPMQRVANDINALHHEYAELTS